MKEEEEGETEQRWINFIKRSKKIRKITMRWNTRNRARNGWAKLCGNREHWKQKESYEDEDDEGEEKMKRSGAKICEISAHVGFSIETLETRASPLIIPRGKKKKKRESHTRAQTSLWYPINLERPRAYPVSRPFCTTPGQVRTFFDGVSFDVTRRTDAKTLFHEIASLMDEFLEKKTKQKRERRVFHIFGTRSWPKQNVPSRRELKWRRVRGGPNPKHFRMEKWIFEWNKKRHSPATTFDFFVSSTSNRGLKRVRKW